MSAGIVEHFAPLEDPRIDRNKLHALVDIVLLTIFAVVSGADGWEAIEDFGREKLEWLRRFAPFRNGVPSHDCIANVVSRLSPKGFQACLLSWTRAAAQRTDGEVIALDGKTARGSRDRKRGRGPLHRVSAWASANRLVLGQEATDAKSNEITAIPKLLELLELRGCLVTTDAMGCQTAIAAQIVNPCAGTRCWGSRATRARCKRRWRIFGPWPRGATLPTSHMPSPRSWIRTMAAWKCVATGSARICARCPIPTAGWGCAASGWWSAPALAGIPQALSGVTSSTPFPRMPALRPRRARALGRGEPPALAPGCGLGRGCQPHPQGPRPNHHDLPAPPVYEPVQTGTVLPQPRQETPLAPPGTMTTALRSCSAECLCALALVRDRDQAGSVETGG